MIKYIFLMLLISCATKTPECKYTRSETFAGTKFVEYQCEDYLKYCKYDTLDSDRQINCFTTRQ